MQKVQNFLFNKYCDFLNSLFDDKPIKKLISRKRCKPCLIHQCHKKLNCSCRCHISSCRKCDQFDCDYDKCICECHNMVQNNTSNYNSITNISRNSNLNLSRVKENDFYIPSGEKHIETLEHPFGLEFENFSTGIPSRVRSATIIPNNKSIDKTRDKWDQNLHKKNRLENTPQKSRNSSLSSINSSVNSKNENFGRDFLEKNLFSNSDREDIIIDNCFYQLKNEEENYDIQFKKFKISEFQKTSEKFKSKNEDIAESIADNKINISKNSSKRLYETLSNRSIGSNSLANRKNKLNNNLQTSRSSKNIV